jgi:hypothetical protein
VVLRKTVTLILIALCANPTPILAGRPESLSENLPPAIASKTLQTYPSNHGFLHQTGHHVPYGWAAMYRIHSPGYFIEAQANGGEALLPGTYRYLFPFSLLPGHLGGLLHNADDVVRIEAWDVTTHECLMSRTIQISDFLPLSKQLTVKAVTFSTWKRAGHRFEPRVYWPGLSGVFLRRIVLMQLNNSPENALARKAETFEREMGDYYLDRGFVVCRHRNGTPEDLGDAAIWTGLYAASEAWRYKATRAPDALDRMQASLQALHQLVIQSPVPGTMVRYIYPDGRIYSDPPSKDTYTGFFFAAAQCLPLVKDRELRKNLLADLDAMAAHFLDHGLSFVPEKGTPVDLDPSLSSNKMKDVLKSLRTDDGERHRVIRMLEAVNFYFLVHGQRPWPELKPMIRHLKQKDFHAVERQIIPFLNGALLALRQLQRNVHKSAIVWSFESAPYQKLDRLLIQMIDQLTASTQPAIAKSDDIKVLASQSIHALHLVKVAATLLPKPNRYQAFYSENLWQKQALLKTAVEWDNIDDALISAVAGDAQAAASRTASSHLIYLALFDLIQSEKNVDLRKVYQTLFENQYRYVQPDYNAMLQVMREIWKAAPDQEGLAIWSLGLYPEDRRGKGEAYWKAHRDTLARSYGGIVSGQARDPLPLSLRQRDPFIWQRSAYSVRGDDATWTYPPLDYLFVYWLARANRHLN